MIAINFKSLQVKPDNINLILIFIKKIMYCSTAGELQKSTSKILYKSCLLFAVHYILQITELFKDIKGKDT